MSFQLRLASAADVSAIQAIVFDAYAHYVERLGCLPAPMGADYVQLVDKAFVWVLASDNRIAGLMVLRQVDDYLLVSNLAVAIAYQGRGLGRALLDHAEMHARTHGISDLRLYTHELMHENVAIYSRLGWEEYHRAEHEGFRRVFMRKNVPQELGN